MIRRVEGMDGVDGLVKGLCRELFALEERLRRYQRKALNLILRELCYYDV